MLLINCPWCGAREETEFRYGGEAVRIPADDDDTGWTHLLYFRSNPVGRYTERWVHVHGCRQWLYAVRDTTTHTVLSTHRLGDPPVDGR